MMINGVDAKWKLRDKSLAATGVVVACYALYKFLYPKPKPAFSWVNEDAVSDLAINVGSPCPVNCGRKGRRRTAISSEAVDAIDAEGFKPNLVLKDSHAIAQLMRVCRHNCLFSHLDESEVGIAVGAMVKCTYEQGDVLIQQGKALGDKEDKFHVISRGTVAVLIDGSEIATIPEGGSFGELALMYSCPSKSSFVAATEEVECWVINREAYRRIIMSISIRKRKMYEAFLADIPWLRSLTRGELLKLADALQPATYEDGDRLISYGEEGQWMFIIINGTVVVTGRDDAGQPVFVCEFHRGDYVGDCEFINNHACVADVVAKRKVTTARLNRKHFEMCLGPVLDIMQRNTQENPLFEYYKQKLEQAKLLGVGLTP